MAHGAFGPYRSTDHGEHWEKLDVPDHGLPVWSLAIDPHEANVLYAGYENCDAVRAAGAAPNHTQDPGYSASLDGDGDGTACE